MGVPWGMFGGGKSLKNFCIGLNMSPCPHITVFECLRGGITVNEVRLKYLTYFENIYSDRFTMKMCARYRVLNQVSAVKAHLKRPFLLEIGLYPAHHHGALQVPSVIHIPHFENH